MSALPIGLLLLLLLLVAAGAGVAVRVPASAPQRLLLAVLGGAVALHLLLTFYDLVGIRWSVPLLVFGLLAIAALGWRRPAPAPPTPRLGWGDAVALAGFSVFAWYGVAMVSLQSDFIWHWGIKAQRFLAVRHVDYAFLARPWNWIYVPDYPNLYPELAASVAMLAGRWREVEQLTWSPVCLLLLFIGLREPLAMAGVSTQRRHAVVATMALLCSAAAIVVGLAGGPECQLGLTLVAALPALLRDPDPESDLQVGVCAAFAAASKLEGVALGGFLVLVQLGRHLLRRRWPGLPSLVALCLLPGAVVLHWRLQVIRHHLEAVFHRGTPTWEHVQRGLPVLVGATSTPSWHYAPWLLLLVPLLLRWRRLRPIATVLLLQVAMYMWSYAAQPVDTVVLISSSWARLLFHVLPAALLALAIAALGDRAYLGEAALALGDGGERSSQGLFPLYNGRDNSERRYPVMHRDSFLPVALFAGVLTFTAAVAAQTLGPSYETLFVQGSAAYGAEDWSSCAATLVKAAEMAPTERQAARAYFTAAACATAKGEKDAAFALLEKAAAKWILWEVDPSISDEERVRWDVPPLSVARKRAEQLNAGTFQPH
ncbi:MAG TPA: hypothetical protein VGX68_12150 [Thermoanaerobaculia bacterium]|jgi:hypothetical protein|nr:hypothetical protein [Thermoanaerobaculia bacterium]